MLPAAALARSSSSVKWGFIELALASDLAATRSSRAGCTLRADTLPVARTRFRAASAFAISNCFIVSYPVSVAGLVNAIQETLVLLPTFLLR